MNRLLLGVGPACLAALLLAGSALATANPEAELEPSLCSITCPPHETAYRGLSGSVSCTEGYTPVCQCDDPLQKMAYCAPISEALAEVTRARQTIQRMRTIGVAMYGWYLDQSEGRECDPAQSEIDLAGIPLIAADELEQLLVPTYAEELPLSDGWGSDFEFRLDRSAPSSLAMSVRSAGADAEFAGTVYVLGGFPATQTARDLIWVDGYFGRWPEKP